MTFRFTFWEEDFLNEKQNKFKNIFDHGCRHDGVTIACNGAKRCAIREDLLGSVCKMLQLGS